MGKLRLLVFVRHKVGWSVGKRGLKCVWFRWRLPRIGSVYSGAQLDHRSFLPERAFLPEAHLLCLQWFDAFPPSTRRKMLLFHYRQSELYTYSKNVIFQPVLYLTYIHTLVFAFITLQFIQKCCVWGKKNHKYRCYILYYIIYKSRVIYKYIYIYILVYQQEMFNYF